MRRFAAVLAGITALLVGTAGPVAAESVTVQGSGDITKMRAGNGDKAVTAKVYGLKAPCEAQYVHVEITSRHEDYYRAEAGCYSGSWMKGLYYHDSADDQNPKKVVCDGFRVRYNADNEFYRVVVPRACIGKAPNRVRVAAQAANYGTTMPGEAGPTKLLDRG